MFARVHLDEFSLLIQTDTLGFLARHRLSDRLIELKVPEKLLDVACHDTHVIVQEFALRVLKQMLKHQKAKDVMRTANAASIGQRHHPFRI